MKKSLVNAALFCLALGAYTASAQGWKWASGSHTPHAVMESFPIAVDKAGNVYETGSCGADTLTFGSITVIDTGEGIVVSTDSNGSYRWALAVTNGNAEFLSVQTDPFGNIYVIGDCTGSSFGLGSKSYSSGVGFFCAKITSAGIVAWIKPMAQHAYEVNSLCINSTGNIYISGMFGNSGGPTFTIGATTLTNTDPSGLTYDVFFAKFDSSGNALWAKSFGGLLNDIETSLAVTSDSEIYVAGVYHSNTMTIGGDLLSVPGWPSPFFVAKFDGLGNPLWARAVPANDTVDYLNSISTDENGSVYLTGNYARGFSFGPDTFAVPAYFCMFVSKYDSSGNAKWGRAINDQNFARGYSIATDACGNIWVAGQSLNFSSPDQLFLAEYDSSGHLEDTIITNAGGDDQSAIAVDFEGNLYVGGDYQHTPAVFGTDTLINSNPLGESLMVLKYNYAPAGCMDALGAAPDSIPASRCISIFPNPAGRECTIHSGDAFTAGSRVDFYDFTGRFVCTHALFGSNTIIPLPGFMPGIFQCRIYTDNGFLLETIKLAVIK